MAWVSCGVVVAVHVAWPFAADAARARFPRRRIHGDVVAIDLQGHRQIVQHVLKVHADERWNGGPPLVDHCPAAASPYMRPVARGRRGDWVRSGGVRGCLICLASGRGKQRESRNARKLSTKPIATYGENGMKRVAASSACPADDFWGA